MAGKRILFPGRFLRGCSSPRAHHIILGQFLPMQSSFRSIYSCRIGVRWRLNCMQCLFHYHCTIFGSVGVCARYYTLMKPCSPSSVLAIFIIQIFMLIRLHTISFAIGETCGKRGPFYGVVPFVHRHHQQPLSHHSTIKFINKTYTHPAIPACMLHALFLLLPRFLFVRWPGAFMK